MGEAYRNIDKTRYMKIEEIIDEILRFEEGYGIMRAFGAEDGEDKLRVYLFILLEKLRSSKITDTRIVRDILEYLGCDDERQSEILRKSLFEKLEVFLGVLRMP